MTKKTMTCPVCGNNSAWDKSYCAVCGWSFPEDCTQNGTLFLEKQLDEYKIRLGLMRKYVNEGGESAKARVGELEQQVRTLKNENERLETANRQLKSSQSSLKQELENARKDAARERQRAELEAKNAASFREQVRANTQSAQYGTAPAKSTPMRTTLTRAAAATSSQTTAREPLNSTRGLGYGCLLPYSIDEICRRIADGSYQDLYVGDSFDVEMPDRGKERFILAGFECLPDGYKGSDGKFRDHFAVVVPEKCLETARMYVTASANRYQNQAGDMGYKESHIYKNVLRKMSEKLQVAMNGHLLHKNGQKELELLSQSQVFGEWAISEQLPLFRMFPERKKAGYGISNTGNWYWLKDQVLNGRFAVCSPNGTLSDIAANADSVGVRPYFCIG